MTAAATDSGPLARQIQMPDTMAQALERASEHFRARARGVQYRTKPAEWAKDRVNAHLWSKQREVAQSVVDNKRTAVKSGHGIGKTRLAAMLCEWWIETHLGEDVMVVTTAPTYDQVRGILWQYIRKDWQLYTLSGEVSENTEWKDAARNLIGIGRKPADSTTANFQGRHYKYTLIIIDESGGITRALFTALDAIATTDTCRVVAIGNPTDPNTAFGNIFLGNGGKGLDTWNKITMSVLDSPNFTDERFECPQELLDSLTSPAWVADKVAEVGIDSADYQIRVLGEFPASSEDSLYSIQLLYQAIENVLPLPGPGDRPKLGVDVARFGSDSTAIVCNSGGIITVLETYKNANGPDSAARIHRWATELNASEVRVDAVGPGSSVIDHLMPLAANWDYRVIEMNGSGMTPDHKKYLNARAFWHAHVKTELLASRITLPPTSGDPTAQRLFDELQNIKYKMNVTWGSLQIESKEDMRKRGVKSPDISDALMYAMAPLNPDDPLLPYGPGDVFSTDPYDEDEYEALGFVISPI